MSDSLEPHARSTPTAAVRNRLLQSLRDLQRHPAGAESARRHLREWLTESAGTPPGPHCELHTLQELADRRRREGASFRMPEHLLECRACLELFQVLCTPASEPAPSPDSRSDGRISGASTAASPARPGPRRHPRRYAAPALAAALLLLLWLFLRPPGLILESGALQQNDETLRSGRLPARTSLQALQSTRISLLDGSSIHLEPGARLRVGKTLRFHPVVRLETGLARFDFLDARTAPLLRVGRQTIPPSAADFTLEITPQGSTVLQVQRGSLRLHAPDGHETLTEGQSRQLAP